MKYKITNNVLFIDDNGIEKTGLIKVADYSSIDPSYIVYTEKGERFEVKEYNIKDKY